MTDILYFTIKISRVGEEDKNKSQPWVIRKAIDNDIHSSPADKCRLVVTLLGSAITRANVVTGSQPHHVEVRLVAGRHGAVMQLRDDL